MHCSVSGGQEGRGYPWLRWKLEGRSEERTLRQPGLVRLFKNSCAHFKGIPRLFRVTSGLQVSRYLVLIHKHYFLRSELQVGVPALGVWREPSCFAVTLEYRNVKLSYT